MNKFRNLNDFSCAFCFKNLEESNKFNSKMRCFNKQCARLLFNDFVYHSYIYDDGQIYNDTTIDCLINKSNGDYTFMYYRKYNRYMIIKDNENLIVLEKNKSLFSLEYFIEFEKFLGNILLE